MKKTFFIFAFIMALLSCSDEYELSTVSTSKDVEVVDLGALNLPSTRSSEVRGKVLRFKDVTVYQRTLSQLRSMSIDETVSYFTKLGFDGAYNQLTIADNELDAIFDIEDDIDFLKAVDKFKEKYDGIFVFNDSDKYDLSPYLSFSDAQLELVGNINGLVMVGDSLLRPSRNFPNYKEVNSPQIATRAGVPFPPQPLYGPYKESSLMIREGHYQSTVQIGEDVHTGLLMIQLASQKKKKFWKRRHKCDYTLNLGIGNFTINNYYQPNEDRGLLLKFIPPFVYAQQFKGRTPCGYSDFHSGACPNQHGELQFVHDFR